MSPHDYSQWGEQAIILRHFGHHRGIFLDIGAHAARENSNTRALADLGWSGVCVEPSPIPFAELVKTYQDREAITLVHALVDCEMGLCEFHDCGGDQLSTTSKTLRDRWLGEGYSHPWRKIYVPAITLWSLNRFGPFDFVNIDTEGMNPAILRHAFNALEDPKLVCVENDEPDGIEAAALEYGWRIVEKTHGNAFLEKRRP